MRSCAIELQETGTRSMHNSRRRPLMILALLAALTLASCSLPMTPNSPDETSVDTSTSMMDKDGREKMKADGVGRFDLTATSVPKESVGLPLNENLVAYAATDHDKPMDITLELPQDTLHIKTSDFKMSVDSSTSYVSVVTWFEAVEGWAALDEAVAAANERYGFTAGKMAAWESKNFMKEDEKGSQSLGMGVKNGTAMYLNVYWKKDSPTQVLQFDALIAPGYYTPEVQAEIIEFGRAPIGFRDNGE